ncbi:MAG: tRNA (adenine-N1)-methyltransferase [Nitrososphaerales archaeon]
MDRIDEGSYVLLFHTPRKKWLTKVAKGKKMHTHLGIIDLDSIIGVEYGNCIKTAKDKNIYLLKPTVHDFIMKSERKTQIVYPKDLGYIAARTGLSNGSIVLEVGTGSGALATFMASIVKPNGHVYSFDVRPEFIEVAKKNIEKAGLKDFVTINQFDIKDGIDLKDVDLGVVDLGDPWTTVPYVHKYLKGGGCFAAICPTMNQVERLALSLKQNHFADIECTEIIMRHIEGREGMTRPSFRMIGHTAYLVFARKVYPVVAC